MNDTLQGQSENSTVNGTNYAGRNRTLWATQQDYSLARVNLVSANMSNGTTVNSSGIQFVLDNSPPGFYINGKTGELLGETAQPHNTTTSTLYATYEGTAKYKLWDLKFEFKAADTVSDANGPNGKGCSGNGKRNDQVEFDQKFTCACDTGFTGENCQLQWQLIGPLTAITAVVLVLVIVWRVQIYRFKRRPIDVNAIQLQLLAELGLGATATMKDNEVGVTVTVVPVDDQRSELKGTDLDKLKVALLNTVAAKLKMSTTTAWVQLGPSPLRALVVAFHKPPGHIDEMFSKKVGGVDQELQSNPILLDGMKVTSVMVALPKRTPHEVPRSALARDCTIASGNSGEVFKGELTERHRGRTRKETVAAKMCKGKASESAQDNLLKEAALMVRL